MTLNLTMPPSADNWLWWQLVIAPLFVALCTFLGTLAWAAAVATGHWCRSFINQVIVKIDLEWLDKALPDDGTVDPEAKEILAGARLYCLVVRFGTDDYLASMASEQERHQGRLINRVVEIERDALLLPVHRKLGTQFKLYYLLPDAKKARTLWQALKQSPIHLAPDDAADRGERIVLDDRAPADCKCWFRLAAYGGQSTRDGFATSYFAASQLRDFERRNRLKRWPWLRRTHEPA